MKKISLLFPSAIFAVLLSNCGTDNGSPADAQDEDIIAADVDGRDMDVPLEDVDIDGIEFPPDFPPDADIPDGPEEEPADRSPFTIVVLPDTQYYSESYPEIFSQQTRWIRDSREERNIVFVIHEGDITNQNVPEQWSAADTSMSILDGHVPYSLCLGNHDIGPNGSGSDRSTFFNDYFPYTRYESEAWYGGHRGDNNNNHYSFFHAGGMKFMVVSLEFGPPDAVLDWANDLVSDNPDSRVIVFTHCYMNNDDTRVGPGDEYNPHTYGVDSTGTNDGEEMWEKFVKLHENIFLVLSGHILGDGLGRLTSVADNGNEVHQVLANYQMLENGGDGWLRIMEFVPEENSISVSTFSPKVYEESGGTGGWKDDPDNNFVLTYDMTL